LFSGVPEFLAELEVFIKGSECKSAAPKKRLLTAVQLAHSPPENKTSVKKHLRRSKDYKNMPQTDNHQEYKEIIYEQEDYAVHSEDEDIQSNNAENSKGDSDSDYEPASMKKYSPKNKLDSKKKNMQEKKTKEKKLARSQLTGPRRCDICGNMFKHLHSLRCHIRVHHSGRPPITCNICDKVYKQMNHLYRHLRNVHTPNFKEVDYDD
jgi:hypothetical protein